MQCTLESQTIMKEFQNFNRTLSHLVNKNEALFDKHKKTFIILTKTPARVSTEVDIKTGATTTEQEILILQLTKEKINQKSTKRGKN